MKRIFAKALTAGAVVCVLMSAPIYADAATPEEAAELARQYGYSEDLIQQGWNEYNANPELYPPEVIDLAAELAGFAGEDAEAAVEALLAARAEARLQKNWALADAVRDRLGALGFTIMDTPQGARVEFNAG